MPRIELTFDTNGNRPEPKQTVKEMLATLPEPFQEACLANPHLTEYVYLLTASGTATPEYKDPVSRADGAIEDRNLIYRVSDELFVHILSTTESDRDWYIPIEPGITQDYDKLLYEIETNLLNIAGQLGEAETTDEKKAAILGCLEQICIVSDNGSLPGNDTDPGRVVVTGEQMDTLQYLVARDKVGMGVLEPLSTDPNIEDISCSGIGQIFVEHKIFKSLRSAITFDTHEDLDEYVLGLSEHIKMPVTLRKPIVDATLPDGSRINIVYGREISRRGSNFTIRKFSETPLSILELVDFGSISYEMVAYISMILEEGMNVFVVGETASGKTTLLNAITTFIPVNDKIITIEDTPELQVPHANWLREVAKQSAPGESGVSMFDLLKAALRQRPNFILIGEIRGEEGLIAFGAMQTGHAVMSTFHAASVEKVIQRITGHPISVPKTHVDNLNVVVTQNAVKLPNGKNGRRATTISEIVSYDPQTESFSYVEVFRWNPATDVFEFVGNKNSYLLEERVAIKRGIPADRKWEIYSLLTKRARILERLHKERGVTDFYELLKILARAQEEGIF